MTPAASLETVTPAHSVLDVMVRSLSFIIIIAIRSPSPRCALYADSAPSALCAAQELMVAKNFRHVPVADGGAMAGMVSIRDVVHVMLKEHREEVGRLNEYIQGTF